MIVKRFYDEKLAQASYLIGCAATGEALMVDANRDVERYLDTAAEEEVRITHVAETHIHADFVSGSRELADRTGARLHLSAEGGEEWQYGFAEESGAVLLRDGDHFEVGNIRIDVVHTPGHTPEHIAFLVTDGAAADRPIAALTGDFVFVGDVGRPDLLEKAAGMAGTMEDGARLLFHSLQRFKEHPDYLQIWPGHGAGSACGKGLSAIPTSTVGYERLFNWAFQVDDQEAFVKAVLEGQPEPPKYFAEMKRINREGPRILRGFERPPRLDPSEIVRLVDAKARLVDLRPAAEFSRAHVPGTINIPLDRSFTTWAGWLVPYDREFYLLVDDSNPARIEEAVIDLAMIGLDRVAGYLPIDALGAWDRAGRALESTGEIDAGTLARRLEAGEVNVLDVRGQAEWDSARIPGVPNIPLGYLEERLEEVPADRPLVVHCLSGARSAIATSLLQANGHPDVLNLADGFAGWTAAGHPVEKGATEPEPAAA
jgi:hydroxyacylglutathione hydrolase